MGADGDAVYVTDPKARAPRGRQGQVFLVPVHGHARPRPLPGAAGTMPQGLTVVEEGGDQVVYFTGYDPRDGRPTVFRLAHDGKRAGILAEGTPLVAPDGIAVTHDGTVYVTDQASSGGEQGDVFRLSGGRAHQHRRSHPDGGPSGAALTLDDSVLLVSSRDAQTGADQVLLIDLATLDTGLVTKVVSENHAAGGVHRAYNQNIFSWSDLSAGQVPPVGGPRGRVYTIELK